MGFFDYITKGIKKDKQSVNNDNNNGSNASRNNSFGTIRKFTPHSFEEVAEIIDTLLQGEPAIVYLTDASENTARRAIDLISGAIYAINGNLCELQQNVYILTPNGVKVN